MKNKDVFDNYDDALEAYSEMCSSYLNCDACPYDNHKCELRWLYDETKEPDNWQKNILDKFSNKE